jgi:hypothetical protein
MTEEIRRRCAYLDALARLLPRLDHDANGNLGAIKLQLDVMVVKLAEQGATVEIAELTPYLNRSMNAIRKFQVALQLQHKVLRWGASGGELFDIAEHVTALGALLESFAEFQVKVPYSVLAPADPVWIEGGDPSLREAVTIAAVEMLFLTNPDGAVTMRLDADGERAALRIEGPRRPADSTPWLVAVRETLARFGGRVEAGDELSLDLIIPMAAVPR